VDRLDDLINNRPVAALLANAGHGLGQDEKDDPATVARDGFDAMMKGRG
jgi:hypothetical protein